MRTVALRSKLGGTAFVAVLATWAAVTFARPAKAQVTTHCYLVVCTGNVCVWKEIACPPPEKI